MYQLIHKDTAAGFDIIFSVTPETEPPDWDFESEEDRREVLQRIDNGDLSWFIARVQAFKHGIELGCEYLGGCCYDSPMQFVNASDYYGDMVEAAVNEARANIAMLVESKP